MASKTGATRKQLGPLKHHLTKRTAAALPLLNEQVPTDLETLDEKYDQVDETINALKISHRLFKEQFDKWVALLENIDDEEEEKREMAIFDTACDPYTNLLYEAEETLSRLLLRKGKLFQKRDQLAQPLGPDHTTTSNKTDDRTQTNLSAASASTAQPGNLRHPYIVKMPKLTLPRFNGNYFDWEQFWGIFEANVHNRPDVSNIEKLTFLIGQLDGTAKQAVAGIQITEDNYNEAVSLLKRRFCRAGDRMITMLYTELRKLPPSDSRLSSKQETFDKCERILRQLSTAGEDINNTPNHLLTVDLLSKFPADMIQDLEVRYGVDPHSPLRDVREALEKLIARQETTSAVLDDLKQLKSMTIGGGSKSRTSHYDHPAGEPTGRDSSALAAISKQPSKSKPLPPQKPLLFTPRGSQMLTPPGECYFCGGDHFNNDCPVYPTARMRKDRLREVRRCDRCMRSHGGIRCPYPTWCIHCKMQGHPGAICFRAFPDQPANRNYIQEPPGIAVRHNSQKNDPARIPSRTWTRNTGQNNVTWQAPGMAAANDSQIVPGSIVRHASQSQNYMNQNQGDTAQVYLNPAAASFNPERAESVPLSGASGGQSEACGANITALSSANSKPTLFQTAKATIVNPSTGQQQTVRLALDTLSSRSYIRDPVVQQLGLAGPDTEKLSVSIFGTNRALEVPTSRVNFEVILRDNSRKEVTANTTKLICKSGALPEGWTAAERDVLETYRNQLADNPYDDDGTIDVLIGAGLVWQFITGPAFQTQAPNLSLIPSKFGLLLAGLSDCEDVGRSDPTMLCITESPCQFPSELGLVSCEKRFETDYPDVDEFWELEKIGIRDDPIENDDDKAYDNFRKTITYEEGRYQVPWPWIEENRPLLPNNYEVAYDRFRSLSRRLKKEPKLLQGYKDILALQQQRDIIEKVPDEELNTSNTTHYLPHHPIVKESSETTKVRIVYDAASKVDRKSLSLNQCLLRGPVILPDLCQLLMRMRVYETIVISDIEKAFLQVGLQSSERDATRFLWFKDDSKLSLSDNIAVYRFKRVSFGVISSPFLLAATIDHHLTTENSEFAESLRNDIYVDNVISGLHGDSSPIQYHTQLKALFSRAGMNIQEFCSNSTQLMDYLPEKDRVQHTDVKVLGIKWDSVRDDTLRLVPSSKLNAAQVTKRTILQGIASIFDPLGYFQPVLLPAKLLLQQLWTLKYGWDDPVDELTTKKWNRMRATFNAIFRMRIPRFIGPLSNECTLAVFSDASDKAYSTVVYLRCPDATGWKVNLLFAKSRLSPVSKKGDRVTLPRLELMGLVIAARAAKFCRDGFQMQLKVDFFVDSECVLRWIQSRGYLKRFIANRITEIKSTTKCEYHYVSSKDNPADFSTREQHAEDLESCEMWWHGPEWLEKDPNHWPQRNLNPVTDSDLPAHQAEMKPAYVVATMATIDEEPGELENFLTMNLNDYSSMNRLVRVSVQMLKFLKIHVWNHLPVSIQQSQPVLADLFGCVGDDQEINSQEYEACKLCWVKAVQKRSFAEIFEALNSGLTHRVQLINQLGIQVDESGLLRTYGRLANADLPESARAPLLLPKVNPFTILLIKDVHYRFFHSGVSHTLSQIRQQYWILQGRAAVKGVLRKCLLCIKYKIGRPFPLPGMPPWPPERVTKSVPFRYTGLDYFGPITVRVYGTITVKMWVCLFTCLAVRAIHLEPVMDCTSAEFLRCLIRFVSRRGVPTQIISDNAAQFRLVALLGQQAWKRTPTDPNILSYSASNGVSWKFITELAPWQGGFYERLVGVVKNALRMSIRRKLLDWTDLVTLLTETEAIVNSRPITYVGDDVDSRFRVIRPCDFLLDNNTPTSDSPESHDVNPKNFGDTGKLLVALWKHRCRTLQKLWSYWYEEYLLSLRERGKLFHRPARSNAKTHPFVNQIVLLSESDVPRGRWKLARVIHLLPSKDSLVRSAEVQLWNGTRLRRAINYLIPLEVEDPLEQRTETTDQDGEGPVLQPLPPAQDPEPSPDDDAQPNWGFDSADIQRTLDALSRFPASDEFAQ